MNFFGIVLLIAVIAGTAYFGYGSVKAIIERVRDKKSNGAGKKK